MVTVGMTANGSAVKLCAAVHIWLCPGWPNGQRAQNIKEYWDASWDHDLSNLRKACIPTTYSDRFEVNDFGLGLIEHTNCAFGNIGCLACRDGRGVILRASQDFDQDRWFAIPPLIQIEDYLRD